MIPVRLRSWILSPSGHSGLAFSSVPALMSGTHHVQAALGVGIHRAPGVLPVVLGAQAASPSGAGFLKLSTRHLEPNHSLL